MKKITLMIFVSLMSFFAHAQLAKYEFDEPWVVPGASQPASAAAPPDWVVINEFGPIYTWVQTIPNVTTQPPYGGTGHSAFLQRENVGPAAAIPSDWLITEEFPMTADAQLEFQSRLTVNNDSGGIYKVYIAKITPGETVEVSDFTGPNGMLLTTYSESQLDPLQSSAWTAKKLEIPENTALWPVGGTVRIAFVMQGDDKDRWFLDDVQVSALCVSPENPVVVATTSTTASLSWNNTAATSWEIEVVADSGTPTGTGEIYSGSLPYVKTGLTSCTYYKYYVRSVCGDGGKGDWVGPVYFKARCVGETCADPLVIPPGNQSVTGNTSDFGDAYEGTSGTGCGSSGNYLAGNDVVYTYTPSATGNYNISLSGTGGPAGLFLYNSCANIGTSCIGGGLASAASAFTIPSFAMTAGTTYYFVISTNGTPQTTAYTLAIQQVFCAAPTAGSATSVTAATATLGWTAGTPGATSWQMAVQAAGSGLPATGQTVTSNSNTVGGTTANIPFESGTAYEFYVRESCGGGTYSIWAGPFLFTTSQVATPMDYYQDFEGPQAGFTLSNGTQINKWVVGTATNNGGTKSLYITDDNGVSNSYANGTESIVHAYKTILLPSDVDQLSLSFDWKAFGESCCDFINVWVVPDSFTPTPGMTISDGDGIRVGDRRNQSITWQTSNTVITPPASWDGALVKLVFEWVNDNSVGSNPPAAIDNIIFKVVTCPQPSDLIVQDLDVTQAVIEWTASSVTPDVYDIYTSQSSTPPTATTAATQTVDGTETTATITPLITAATYYVWVRSHCSDSDQSFWTGPVSFNTPQIPADMPYAQNFDAGAHNFTLSNGTAPNKWIVGASTSSSPAQSLYITNDGTSYGYESFNYTVVHAYRDIQLPADIPSGQVLLNFDWKNLAAPWGSDIMRVYIAPVTYSPTVGNEISEDGDVVKSGPDYYNNDQWITANNVIDVPSSWNGTVRRVIFEWRNSWGGGTFPAAVDNVGLSVITCPAPSDVVLDALTIDSASISWTPPAAAPGLYDYYISTDDASPIATTTPTDSTTDPNVVIPGLAVSTNYNFWVRSNCDVNGTSFWVGPLKFVTPQIPAVMPYTESFDGTTPNYTFNTNNDNEWIVGTATSNSPANSLYVTNDDGATNSYNNNNGLSIVHAYRDIQLPATIASGQVLLNFDWKSVGVQWGGDVLRVYVAPVTFGPTAGESAGNNGDVITVGQPLYNNNTWKTANNVVDIPAAWNNNIVRVIFEWENNWSDGTIPAAVDNVGFSVITCSAPTDVALASIDEDNATFTWTAPADAPDSYEYYLTTSPVPPVAGTVPTGTGITETTVTITGLPANTNYYIWIRSNCGDADGNSFWVGGINFNTPQIPAVLPYAENFEGTNPDYTYIHLDQPNKWAVGGATFSSPSKSMYVTNDNGVTNSFTNDQSSVIHTYRDIVIPADITDLDFTFDWKSLGEEWGGDFLTVWMVPLNYLPVAGTEITEADGVKLTPQNLFNNAVWKSESLVIPVTAQAGSTQRFVFQWVNNSWSGGETPAAVDNVEAKVLTCPKPIDLNVSDVGMTQATLNWTEVGTADSWEVYVVPQGGALPGTTTEGTPAPTNGFPYSDLEPGTNYQFYVRSICGPDDLSRWSGPFDFHTNVCEVVDQCSYNFVMTSAGNGWGGNTMSILQGGIVVATIGSDFTSGEGPETVSLQLCTAVPYQVLWNEGGWGDIGLSIVNNFNGQTVFNKAVGSGESEKTTIIYEGIAYCSEITCPQPTNLVSESVVNAANTTNLSWTPGGTETQWEVVVQTQNGGFPDNIPATSTVVSEPHLVLSQLATDTLYEYYVRAICDDDNNSFWSGPLSFSIFTPPACADVTVIDENLEVIAPDTEYIICPEEDFCVNFSASYYEGAAQTTSYEVIGIPFIPPFPTLGGTEMRVDKDDIWSPRIDLPFEFCFMGEVYNAAQVGSNGIVSFNADQPAGGGSGYSFYQTIPDTSFPQLNAIYGVYQDTNPDPNNNGWDDPNINYQVLGNYPCRALVVSFNELAQFNCSTDSPEHQAIGAQSSQIVIYEITNIIEVYVKRRVPCTNWQNGVGLIGVQNATGDVAFTPPGRNTGDWTATEEAWRFTPNGESTATFEWLKDGVLFSTSKDIEVCALQSGTTTMTARASYQLCNGNVIVRESDFSIKVQEQIIPANEPIDLTECGNGEDVTFDLNDAVANAFDTAEMPNYTFTFYATQADATAGGTNSIPASFVTNTTTTVWVRIMRAGQPCFKVYSFETIVSNNPPKFTVTAEQSICEGTSAIITVTPEAGEDLSTATYLWTLDGNAIAETTNSITVTAGGVYNVTVSKGACVDSKSTSVTVVAMPIADAPENQNACDSYVLPALSEGNNYFTGANGTGTALSAGETITTSQRIYVYAVAAANTACFDENFFDVTITATPQFAFIDDCESNVYYVEVTDVDGSFDIDQATYAWTGPEGFTSSDRKMVPPVAGEYTVTVTTDAGCISTDIFEVLSTSCMIPRGISPNGDGKNDEFDLSALDVKKLEIFNRYGQEVYSKSNYTNQWIGQTNKGDELPTGTYFYMIERTNGETKTGWVYINRQE